MGVRSIRLSSTLTLSEEQEADIIKLLEELNSTHKTGQFMSNLIRIAVDCPDILRKTANGSQVKGDLMKQLDNTGMATNRKEFMNDVTKSVAEMKSKVDAIYEMCMKTYTLARMGKELGLEEKSNKSLMANFILEKQLKELQETLGVSIKDDIYASNKLSNSQKSAEDTLEYIIETYSGIVEELKKNMSVQTVQVVQTVPVEKVSDVETAVLQTNDNEIKNEQNNKTNIEENKDDNDEFVDFGTDGGLEALSLFFGN